MTDVREMKAGVTTFFGPLRDDVQSQLEACGPIRLNLGCGEDYIPGWCNVDYGQRVKCDVNLDLDDHMLRLPWDDGVVDAICAYHIIEHIKNLPKLKTEIARVLRPDGLLFVLVPNYLSLDAWGDDTHCRAFSIHSFMGMYWPGLSPKNVKILEVKDELGNDITWLLAEIKGG